MKKTVLIVSAACLLLYALYYKNKVNTFDYLQSISCIVKTAEGNYGSGVIKIVKGRMYVITAHHIVAKTIFDDVSIIQYEYYKDKCIGRRMFLAKILNKSPTYDLALLQTYGPAGGYSCRFYASNEHIPLGTPIIATSSPFGEDGYNAISMGVMSQYDRETDVYGHEIELDEASCLVWPGCSGGGVYLTDGRLAGITVVRFRAGSCWFVPIRIIFKWIKEEGLNFLL